MSNFWIYGAVGRWLRVFGLLAICTVVGAHEGVPITGKEIDDQQNGTPTAPPWQAPPIEPDPTSPPDAYDTSSYPAPIPDSPRDQDCSTPVSGPCLNVRLCSCW